MFIHQGKLEYLLKPEDYSNREFWEDEVRHLFRRSWQFAALRRDVAENGAYLARDVAGVPVVIRNFDGEIKAFLNVCPHRHSMLVREGKGCSEKLKCLYHGWEYGEAGQLTHLPDGKSFRGIKAADYCLDSVRLEIIGELIFINLNKEAESLVNSVAALGPELHQYFGDHEPLWHWVSEHRANWKLVEENAVESYHVPMAHPSTFTDYKAPELHDHTLHGSYTRYDDIQPWGTAIVDRGFRFLSRALLPEPNFGRFKQTHIFPNNLLYYNELFSTWAAVYPVSPEVTRYEIVGLVPRKLRGGAVMRGALRLIVKPLIRQLTRILGEDMEVWGKLHHGLEHSPFKGVLSCREERVFAFHQHVLERMPEKWRNR
jgi:choline monooxygenase